MTKEEVDNAYDIYANFYEDFILEIDRVKAKAQFLSLISSPKTYFNVLKNADNVVTGFVIACVEDIAFAKDLVLRQKFFVTNERGIKAAKMLYKAHEELIVHARKIGVKHVMSGSSEFEDRNVVAMLLEKKGWKRMGRTALYTL
jgi:hypothetical protein